MKKIILTVGVATLLIGSTVFARGMGNMGRGTGACYQNYSVAYGRNYNNSNTHYAYGRNFNNPNTNCGYGRNFNRNGLTLDKKLEENRIFIAERRIEIRKELLKDTPDWNRVEKLNQEIVMKRTENQKYNMENRNYNCRFL